MTSSLHSEEYKALREYLRSARKGSGVTQQVLAQRLGKAQSFVSKIERGERRIDLVEFVKWVEALGVSAPDTFASLFEFVPKL